jgi:hypothetical protein
MKESQTMRFSSSRGPGACIRRLLCLGPLLWTGKLALADAVEEAWAARLYWGDENEEAVDLDVDRLGNVYVTGSGSRGGASNIRTFKYAPDGKLLWRATFHGGTHGWASGVREDGSGGAYVLCEVADGAADSPVLLKYAGDGDLAWSRDIGLGVASSLQVGADGNACVGGHLMDPASGERRGIIAKVSPSGEELWRHLEGPEELVMGVRVAPNGEIIASLQNWCTPMPCQESSFRILKLSASGERVWSWTFDREGRDRVSALDVNEAGEVYVMGSHELGALPLPPAPAVDWLLIKLASDGREEWATSLGEFEGAFALDSDSNVYVSSSPRNEGPDDNDRHIELRKFSPRGSLLWSSLWEGPVTGGFDGAGGIKFDRLGGVYLGGLFTKACLESCNEFRTGALTLKYAPDGRLAWDMRFDAGASDISAAWIAALKVDGAGNVYAVGTSGRQETGTGRDFLTIKYLQPDFGGAVFVRGDANGDGRLNVTDPLLILRQLFQGGIASPCARAADPDDSGALDLGDAVYVLQYLFRSGAAPPAPYPECGEDPTPDDLPCESSSCA